MDDNIKYAYAWQSTRRQNRFTVQGTGGDDYSFTVQAPKNIKTVGGVVKWLHDQNAHGAAYSITKALKDMEARAIARSN